MRWNCPHCGINLAVADDKLGAGWSFSRCYKCGGFALVRRSDVNLIKVDRAPSGERVLLPEASEEPMLSNTATQNLARYISAGNKPEVQTRSQGAGAVAAGKPIIRSAARRNAAKERAQAAPSPAPKIPRAPQTSPAPQAAHGGLGLPEPLPEVPSAAQSRVLPIAIGVAGALSIASGVYLYIQGQNLWHKARATAAIHRSAPVESAARESHETRDSVKTTAAAPEEIVRAPALAQQPATAPIAAPPASDDIHSEAMAPLRTTAAPAKESTSQMTIRIKVENANLHSGPGLNYPVIGKGDVGHSYAVADWRDRWFKITLPDSDKQAQRQAWIRNDLVQRVTQ